MADAKELILFNDNYRVPPADVEQAIRESFPECFLEWMPRAKRWAVMRRVPWESVDRLVGERKLTEADIQVHKLNRYEQGYNDQGPYLVIHAFTVQDPANGDPVEPGTWLVEALKRADTFSNKQYPGGIRGAIKDIIGKRKAEEAALDTLYKQRIDDAIDERDYLFRGLPRMAYPTNPIGGDNVGTGNSGSAGEASSGPANAG